ncbi:AcrR family transcriptional regulator [Sphingopyxis panaciterrae]|uniref:TetR family transcriptional regulator n=1 Tax=Sphingopyxis panaciterrae TaxID=363841 RepID=UPI0014221F9A|nr:AcrR family transcriptional regulator [Sphingopyxis panaciterrae]
MPREESAKKKDSARLGAPDWIEAALDVLSEHGIDRVSVEPIAKRLGVTKGSFYWHFKDRDDFLEAILGHWRRRATLQIIERIERADESPRERFIRLMRLPFRGSSRSRRGAEIELSIRLWGRSDPRARAALTEVDQLRLSYIRQLLVAAGVSEVDAPARAIQAYSYMRVATTLIAPGDEVLIARCESDLATPREMATS